MSNKKDSFKAAVCQLVYRWSNAVSEGKEQDRNKK